jgi:ubiquinone/menaquinone biosynthesis C-methylase UbiE
VTAVLVVVGLVVVLAGAFVWVRWVGQHHPAPMAFWLEGFFLNNPLRRVVFRPGFVVEAAGDLTGRRVTEIGVGTGMVMEALARAAGPTGTLSGVDLGPQSVLATRQRLARQGLAADIRQADARQLPWADASVDVAVMVAMLGELPPTARVPALREVRRILDPEGALVVIEYWPDPHYLTPSRLDAYLAEAGFRVEERRRAFLQHGVRARPDPEEFPV